MKSPSRAAATHRAAATSAECLAKLARVRSSFAFGLLLLATLVPQPVHASNLVHPRTPVLWPESPCIVTTELGVTPSFEFEYDIPEADTQLSSDEFEDSRTHQFIGFCRQWPAGRPPPRYISTADLERSVEAGIEEAAALDDPESTLETSQIWAGCWTRITADDARRPITEAAAAEPVVWDLAAVQAGTYLIAGYTWEPPYNLWSRAPWVLRVVDPLAPGDPQAAVSIADTEDFIGFDEVLDVPLCVDATAGSTLSLQWAASEPAVLEWAIADEIVLDGPTEMTLPFTPPAESFGASIVLRAVVEQPAGLAYEGHALSTVIVFAPPSGDGDGDGDPTESGDGDSTEDGDGGSTETGAPPATGDGGGGRCSLGPNRGRLPTFAILLGLSWIARVRRRREP